MAGETAADNNRGKCECNASLLSDDGNMTGSWMRAAAGHRHEDGRGNRKQRKMVQTVTESMLRWLPEGRNQLMVGDFSHELTGVL